MAQETPPYVLQSGSHPAELFRRAISTLLGTAGGVVNANDYLVTQNGSPNMSVNVAGGRPGGECWVPGTSSTQQAQYYAFNTATVNLTIAASNPSNPRIDTPMVQIQDAAYAGAVNSASLSILTGTPAASPVAPTLPASSLALANVLVPAASTSVVTGNITDRRVRATLGPQVAALSITDAQVNAAAAIVATKLLGVARGKVGANTRLMHGLIDPAGAIVNAGSGDWSSTRTGTGVYQVTFTGSFSVAPAVVVTANPGSAAICPEAGSATTALFLASFVNPSNVLTNTGFSFIVCGVV